MRRGFERENGPPRISGRAILFAMRLVVTVRRRASAVGASTSTMGAAATAAPATTASAAVGASATTATMIASAATAASAAIASTTTAAIAWPGVGA